MARNGFTLIEVLIVVAISTMLTAMAITYSSTEREQIALSVEETKISQFILQARSLSIATYGNAGGSVCGYGVLFDASSGTYSIFAYIPNLGMGTTCPVVSSITSAPGAAAEAKYTNETWRVSPQGGVTFSTSGPNALSLILFYPPNPDTLLFDGSGSPISQASIKLTTADGKLSHTISVNSAGQLSF
jgi:prepilin-type N-terminal cleavage/methylation domain-containing protein